MKSNGEKWVGYMLDSVGDRARELFTPESVGEGGLVMRWRWSRSGARGGSRPWGTSKGFGNEVDSLGPEGVIHNGKQR